WGGGVQVATTVIKVGFLLLVVLLPFVMLPFSSSSFSFSNWTSSVPIESGNSLPARFGIVLLAVMWAYNGWHGVTPIAEGIRAPQRNVRLALVSGISLIVVLYLGANLAYHGALSRPAMIDSKERAAETMLETLLGTPGVVLI